MLDETGRQRWISKLDHHRRLRKDIMRKDIFPYEIYKGAARLAGAMIEDWFSIFKESWERVSPLRPVRAAEDGKREISVIIATEEALINSEVEAVFGKPDKWTKDTAEHIGWGKQHLNDSCGVLKFKAFSEIDNQRADRAGQIWKEGKSLAEIALAVFGAVLLFNQTQIAKRQTEIQARQEQAATADHARTQQLDASRLRHRIWETLDLYPKSGKGFAKLAAWERRDIFEKIERQLREEELNPELVQDEMSLSSWRRALAACRDIQTEHIYLDENRFQQRAALVKTELTSIIERLVKQAANHSLDRPAAR